MDGFLAQLEIKAEVQRALAERLPVVAMESTVITHGLPYPQNRDAALTMEGEVRSAGGVPATIALLDGRILVGITSEELERLATSAVDSEARMMKVSRRDFAPAIARRMSGGTTVAGTMIAAAAAGIRVFATGGIGGVHREPAFDISTDLTELAQTRVIVVCAGAKAILNLDATLEYLETAGVPVIGFGTDEFPAFYSRSSGLPVSVRANTPEEIAVIAAAHWTVPGAGGILVANPPPEAGALPRRIVEEAVEQALADARAQAIRGQAVTPYLLERVSRLTGGASLHANLELLRENARLAGQIAAAMIRR